MKITSWFCVFYLILSCFNNYAQQYNPYNNHKTTYTINKNKSGENKLENLPFQIGIEFGPALPIKEKKYFYNGWWIYGNINLYQKRIFLKLSYGNLKLNEDLGGTAPNLILGATFIPLKINEHSIALNLGLSFYAMKSAGILSYSAGLNYLYRLNRYVSFIAGIQMPVIRESHYDEYYQNPFLNLGIQFF